MEGSDLLKMQEKLIFLVESNRSLYDKGMPGYRNAGAQKRIWESIGRQMGVSDVEVKARWKTVRERYVREKKAKESAERSGAGAGYHVKWPLFDACGFLKQHVAPKSTVSSFEPDLFEASSQHSAFAAESMPSSTEVIVVPHDDGSPIRPPLSPPLFEAFSEFQHPPPGPLDSTPVTSQKRKADASALAGSSCIRPKPSSSTASKPSSSSGLESALAELAQSVKAQTQTQVQGLLVPEPLSNDEKTEDHFCSTISGIVKGILSRKRSRSRSEWHATMLNLLQATTAFDDDQ